MKAKGVMSLLILAGVILTSGCQHSVATKSNPCDTVEHYARSSQGLMDWASNDGQEDVDRSAHVDYKDSSDDPGVKYDCAASAKSASSIEGEKE